MTDAAPGPGEATYVTATIAGQLVGVPIGRVQDVFRVGRLTPVPMAPPGIAGLLNLRGRIVTAIDLRDRLGLPGARRDAGAMAIGLDGAPDSFGLVVDSLGEIVTAPAAPAGPMPGRPAPEWAGVTAGLRRVPDGLLVILDVDAAIEVASSASDPSDPGGKSS